jgi:tRNA threonylcarbamoyladenosine biosynthesis protein TsaE
MSLKQVFTCEAQLTAFAAKIAMSLVSGDVVYLRGELGTGKTTFARAIIQQMGRVDSVTSPTFTLIETHDLN